MASRTGNIQTQAIHAGEPRPRIAGAVTMPIFQSANFESAGETSYDAIRYLRLNNTPSQVALHDKLAVLEGGEAALVTASGMAAISTALLTMLLPGGHLLVQSDLYGGTHDFVVFGVFQRRLGQTTVLLIHRLVVNQAILFGA